MIQPLSETVVCYFQVKFRCLVECSSMDRSGEDAVLHRLRVTGQRFWLQSLQSQQPLLLSRLFRIVPGKGFVYFLKNCGFILGLFVSASIPEYLFGLW